jgi:hypothetical protein
VKERHANLAMASGRKVRGPTIVRAQGSTLFTGDGARFLDGARGARLGHHREGDVNAG